MMHSMRSPGRSPFGFIVRPLEDKRYSNTIKVNGIDVLVSSSEEEYKFSNRYATVLELPVGYLGEIKQGDLLLVHHNCFKFYNDIHGNRKSGKSFLGSFFGTEDLFLIDESQFFGYNNGNGWLACENYCFISPIKVINNVIHKLTPEEPLIGKVKFGNEYLQSKGVNEGDMVCFQPDSEYEFLIEGEKVYRMFNHQIVLKL